MEESIGGFLMIAIRNIINVKNKKIIIKLPYDFNSDKAEVIIQNVL